VRSPGLLAGAIVGSLALVVFVVVLASRPDTPPARGSRASAAPAARPPLFVALSGDQFVEAGDSLEDLLVLLLGTWEHTAEDVVVWHQAAGRCTAAALVRDSPAGPDLLRFEPAAGAAGVEADLRRRGMTFTPWHRGPIYRIVLACACGAAVEV
jgi:hypothetical protein